MAPLFSRIKINNLSLLIIISLFSVAYCVSYAMYAGMDYNWDLHNYHIYAVYAVLEGRVGYDIAPAQLQTWFNPIGSILPYFVVMNTDGRIGTIILALISSLNIPIVYLLSREVFKSLDVGKPWKIHYYSIMSAIAAAISPIYMSEIGTTFNDNIIASLVMGAIYLVISPKGKIKRFLIAGILLGVATAFKLTAVVYVVPFAISVIVTRPKKFIREALISISGFLIAFLSLSAPWMVKIYLEYGNPIMPLYNNLFESPLYKFEAITDQRFVFKSIWDFINIPFKIAAGGHPTAEVYFNDYRYSVSIIAFIVFAALLVGKIFKNKKCNDDNDTNQINLIFIGTFCIVCYLLWGRLFGIQRYAIVLEQLLPVFIIAVIHITFRKSIEHIICSTLLVALICISVQPANWGRSEFRTNWFSPQVPAELKENDALYLIVSDDPISYIAPFLSETARFVRVEGNFKINPSDGFGVEILKIIANHSGEVRTLSKETYNLKESQESFSGYGLTLDNDNCLGIPDISGNLRSCLLLKNARSPAS